VTAEVQSDGLGREAPPVGEEIHLPGPSFVPLLNAFGVAVALVGLALGRGLMILGLAIFLVTLVRWIRETRRDIDQLPREH
jgi:hypothetical protein